MRLIPSQLALRNVHVCNFEIFCGDQHLNLLFDLLPNMFLSIFLCVYPLYLVNSIYDASLFCY